MRPINRKSKMLLGILAVLLTMSVGYAYFSKEITFSATVTGKGSFNVTASCTKGMSSDFASAYATYLGASVSEVNAEFNSIQKGYTTDTCTVSGSTVTMNTALSYPGAARFYTIILKNTGNIRAKWHYEDGFYFNYQICNGTNAANCSTSTPTSTLDYDYMTDTLWDLYPTIRHGFIKKSSGAVTMLIDGSMEDAVDSDGYIYLEPNDSIYFLAYNLWDSRLAGDDYNNANGSYVKWIYTYDFTFEQATE